MRNWLIVAAACACLAVACAASANAADDPHGEGAHEKKSVGVTEGLFKGAIETTLWTIVVFVVLFFVLRATAWKQIVEGLNKREQAIAQDKHDANLAKQEAAQMREKLAAEMAKANAEIRAMIDKARTDAQQTAAEELARGKADLVAERERGYRDVATARVAMQKDVFDSAVQLASLISSKTMRKQLGPDDHRALLDEALAEFRSAAASRKADLESATA